MGTMVYPALRDVASKRRGPPGLLRAEGLRDTPR